MPTYVYRCNGCAHEAEFEFKMGKAPSSMQHDCGGDYKRVWTATNMTNVNRFGKRSKRDTGRNR